LKALINNLGERLEHYARMLGRRCTIWHGDVGQADRRHTRIDPPDVLATTPESIEAMLISTSPEMRSHLKCLQAVVVDEIHAFAGDDRGWHLLCVLERLNAKAGKDLQRIGLSATVGNPEELLRWLAGNSTGAQTVVQPPLEVQSPTDVTLDFVGSLENAATVISRLHRREKRLAFCDSRSRVETLAGLLKAGGVQAFVSHSSLSASERRRSEEAFARGDDCVIVATSTLELGIDVGDLDRVIQIDAPKRVASFLQRLGRTGRRPGRNRNCLFLCTNEDALLRAVGLLHLWTQGYVEPIHAPPLPYHIVAQQALALCLERCGLGRQELSGRLRLLPAAREMNESTLDALLQHLVTNGLLATDCVRYFMGEEGEATFGRRNFLELVSVFASAPVLSVTDGRHELGMVDQHLFLAPEPAEGRILSLAGRSWWVERVDWRGKRVYVKPTEQLGKTVWFGAATGVSLAMSRTVRTVLTSEDMPAYWSQRTIDRMQELRTRFAFLKPDRTTLAEYHDQRISWFTFAGEAINLALREILKRHGIAVDRIDDYAIHFSTGFNRETFAAYIRNLDATAAIQSLESSEEAERALKFAQCVPPGLLREEIVARRCEPSELATVLGEEPACVRLGERLGVTWD
jgi:ATP-dependent helicase Lhr and Lhr-like helicase